MMRTLLVATAMLSMAAATNAEAGQRVIQHGPGMTRPMVHPPMTYHPGMQGRWWGGTRAPGGWGAYRRPVRGFVLPSYWIAPSFYVQDFRSYSLPQPPQGYRWTRYYDDAVMIDDRGSVYDTIGGVDWSRWDTANAGDQGQNYQGQNYQGQNYQGAYDRDGYDSADYRQEDHVTGGNTYPANDSRYSDRGAGYGYPDRSDSRGNSGIGGAAVGAVAGGVAGNLIAGRGNRLGGTLIGAGVGAAAGYAVGSAADRRRERDDDRRAPGYGAGYAAPSGNYSRPPAYAGNGTTVTQGGGSYAGGYYSNGYYYPGPTITTVTVSTQPVVTTTTTEFYEDSVTYTRPAAKRVWRKKRYHARPKCVCR